MMGITLVKPCKGQAYAESIMGKEGVSSLVNLAWLINPLRFSKDFSELSYVW